MTPHTGHPDFARSRHHTAGVAAIALVLTRPGLASCWVAFRKGFVLAAGVAGTSTICTTAQGILGYLKVASDPTSFQIKAYSAAPPAALFRLPAGAKVTTSHQVTK